MTTTWDSDKRLSDFQVVADNLRREGYTSRAEAVEHLIGRIEALTKEVSDLKDDIETLRYELKEGR